jgi:hypothetical protein
LDAHYKANDAGVHDPLKRIVIDLSAQWAQAKTDQAMALNDPFEDMLF